MKKRIVTNGRVKRSYYRHMLLLFSSIAVCSLILLCAITSGIFNKAITTTINDGNRRVLELTQKIVDDVFSETVSNITQLSTDPAIQRYLREDAIRSYSGFIQIKDRIVQMSTACSFLDSIYVVYPKLDYVVTSYGYFFDYDTFHDDEWLPAFEAAEDNALLVWMGEREISHALYSTDTVHVLTCVSRLPFDFSRGEVQGYLVFNIRADYIRNFLTQDIDELSSVIIWDDTGKIVCSSFGTADVSTLPERGYGDIDLNQPSQQKVIDGRDMLVSLTKSSVAPLWTLAAYTDIMFLNNASRSILFSALCVGVALILVTLIAIYFSSNFIYTPIERLARVSSDSKENIQPVIERYADLNDIYTNISAILSENSKIKRTMEKHRSTLVDHFLVSLLLGHVPTNEATREYMQYLDLKASEYRCYVVGLVRMDSSDVQGENVEISALRRILVTDSANKRAWSYKYSCHVVEMASGTLAMILGLPSDSAAEYQSFNFFNDIYSLIQSHLNLNVTICVSEAVNDLFDMPRMFRQADDMLKCASIYNRHELMMYASFPTSFNVSIDLPACAKDLTAAIRAGNEDDVRQILDELREKVEEAMLKRERVESILGSLYSVVLISVTDNDGQGLSLKAGNPNFHVQQTVDGLFGSAVDQFLAFARCNAQHDEDHLHDTAKNILNYLKENYYRDIGLNDVSEKFLYTATYINRVLKFSTSKTFYELLTDIRIAKAKEYLKTTQLSVTSISERVGYSNVQSFIRMFKRKLGETPSQYRQNHLH